jgi:hypothetical protein
MYIYKFDRQVRTGRVPVEDRRTGKRPRGIIANTMCIHTVITEGRDTSGNALSRLTGDTCFCKIVFFSLRQPRGPHNLAKLRRVFLKRLE